MPQQDHHSAFAFSEQSSQDQDWQHLVEQRLPADLETQAHQLKAFQRARGLPSALHLLRGLLYYVLSHSSLREVSAWSRLIGLTSKVLSGQAWHQRLLGSADWLLWLFNALLAAPPRSFGGLSQRILLVDATHVSCRDKRADTWRLHCAYDLLAGRLAWLRISTQRVGEGFAHLWLQAGDIVVGDGAYSRGKQLLAVAAAGAFSLVRYSPAHLPLWAPLAPAWRREHRLDVSAWLRTLRPGLSERQAVVVEPEGCLPVRVLALVLPEAQAEALRRQKQHQAQEHGRTLSPRARFLAGYVLLLTTLPQSGWPPEQILALYRARWQIEVLFKRLKGVLSVHRLSAQTPQSAQAMICALLVAWLLIEEEVEDLRRQLSDGEPVECPLSSWRLARLALQGLRKILEGHWTNARLRALLPELRRLWRERRQRRLREHHRRYQFCQQVLCQSDLVMLFGCSSA
jgi:Transposase DDE domain